MKRHCSAQSREKWRSVVGLEVHAQLNSESKLFSGSPNRFGGLVNNYVSLFDAAIPGTLPVLNRRCVELGILTALALSCKINEVSMFDRKHYFYADLPAGYQITQQRAPLANDGIINFQVFTPGIHKKPYKRSSKIKQIQLEQDSGKSLHDSELKQSLVDLNRAGVPLIELVFEPDLEDGEEAAALVKELVLIVQRLGVCSGRMEEGALRVDANVSIHRPGEPLGTRTEIKNIGSVRGVAGAIRHEIERQHDILKCGGCIVNETRAWDAVARRTVAMRDKEQVQDYRYMPEPNLPPLRVNLMTEKDMPDVISVPRLHGTLPELPEQTRQKLMQKYELRPDSVIQLVSEPTLLKYFNNIILVNYRNPNKLVNFLLNELVTALNKNKIDIEDCALKDSQIGEIVDMLAKKKIDLEGAGQLLDVLLLKPDVELTDIIKEQHLSLVIDEEEITRKCIEVIRNNPKLVKQYKDGKIKVFKALLGILAKDTQHRLDMSVVSKKLEDLLKRVLVQTLYEKRNRLHLVARRGEARKWRTCAVGTHVCRPGAFGEAIKVVQLYSIADPTNPSSGGLF
ncbi:Glutamyl-tRNA(Gln) amidotransferase subunit B, mitochondrial [Eumeta japonica]|uniref:Glutamyl-tRNA(Gln) amidotransferase subunit B, mitochondrial n=1 Tax=Eumeta variegata TaxID=151549 RepID=A0A4C1T0X4_EUMVA|nr:Glutamyl-tRNA(Gln) amidotransferase subunit B, mitochondrial [Eumeta japonica]